MSRKSAERLNNRPSNRSVRSDNDDDDDDDNGDDDNGKSIFQLSFSFLFLFFFLRVPIFPLSRLALFFPSSLFFLFFIRLFRERARVIVGAPCAPMAATDIT